jgi:O-antigen ligase
MSEVKTALASSTLMILAIAFALAGPILALAPLGMTPLVIVAALTATVSERLRTRRWPRIRGYILAIILIFLAYSEISLGWDINKSAGVRKLVDITVVAVAMLALTGLASRMSNTQQRFAAQALICGAVTGLILLGIETIFDFPIFRAIMGNSDPRLEDLMESKRSVDALPLLIWPAALALSRLRRPLPGIALAVIFTIASFRLTAASATVAMVLSLGVYALAARWLKFTRSLVAICSVLAFVAVIPVSIGAYHWGGTTTHWLKHSAHHRIEIWHFTAERALERFVLGHGIGSSRFVPNGKEVSAFQDAGKPIIPLHPHDAFLQIWLELGLFGVMIATTLMLFPFSVIPRWPPQNQRFVLAGYVAGIIIAGLSFGIWQTWWMATLTFSVVACRAIGPGPNNA